VRFLLQTHGIDDQIIPMASAQKLHHAAMGNKLFVPVEGGTHNSAPSAEYLERLSELLHEATTHFGCIPGPPVFTRRREPIQNAKIELGR
jgi:fermentation-respiration switch protein FrsA (DUF1100 family)